MKIVVFGQDEILVGDGAEERRSMLVSLPNSPPIERCYQNSILYINQVISKKMGFLRCPAQFWEIYTEFFNPHLNRTFEGIECRPYCVFWFFTTVLVDFVFFGMLDRSFLSRKKTEKSIGPTLNAWTINSAWTTPCQKIRSKFVKLMEAWSIRRLNIFMSGPARRPINRQRALSCRPLVCLCSARSAVHVKLGALESGHQIRPPRLRP